MSQAVEWGSFCLFLFTLVLKFLVRSEFYHYLEKSIEIDTLREIPFFCKGTGECLLFKNMNVLGYFGAKNIEQDKKKLLKSLMQVTPSIQITEGSLQLFFSCNNHIDFRVLIFFL